MIRYSLECAKAHRFEAWFRNADAFDRQAERRQVTCPTCGSTAVTKAVMAPSVVRSRNVARTSRAETSPPPSQAASTPDPVQRMANTAPRDLVRMMRKLRDEVVAKSEYVGPRFAEEARKIHNEEAEQRGIYGEATPGEVKDLVEDGVEVYPLPVLPEEHN